MSNMDLWESVQKTDTQHTKEHGGMTAINFQYMIMKATKAFGPVGIGWGYDVLEERIDEGAEYIHAANNSEPIRYKGLTHTIKIKLWYKYNGEKGEVVNYGHTPFVMKSKYGPYQDDDPAKKSLSDAIKKCLSMIGFSADVFLGMYDDFNYKQALELEAKHQAEKEREERENRIKDTISEVMKSAKTLYSASTTIPALNRVHKSCMADIRREYEKANKDPQVSIDALVTMYNEQKEKIQ